ncbi:hypothetical protein Tco_0789252 [Tanacetum coccineum]
MQNFLKKYDHIPHNEKSIKLLLAEEKFLKIKHFVEEEQTQPEHLQELLQSLLKNLQILNDIQPLKQETIKNPERSERRFAELLAEERLQKDNQALNESQSPQEIRIQDLEIQKQQYKIYELKDKFNGLSIEIRKVIQEAEELRESEARARSQTDIIDDDGRNGHINTAPGNGGQLVFAHLAPISPEIIEVCVDDDDTDDDDDYDDDFYDCVDIEEDGGEIDLDISKIVDISLQEKLVEIVDLDLPLEEADVPSFSDDSILRGIESDSDSGEDTTSINALPLDDSMILSEYESFTFDDEPVMAEVNVFDEINTSEFSYPGIGVVEKGVVAINPQTLAAEWGLETKEHGLLMRYPIWVIGLVGETDIHKRTKNKAKDDKTEHGMEKREKTKSIRSQSQPGKK